MEAERRKEPRFTVQQLVEISFGRELLVRAHGTNLSRRGMSCRTDSYLEPSTVVTIMFRFPLEGESFAITCDGLVVWSEPRSDGFEAGISFSPLSDEDADALERFLAAEAAAERDEAPEGGQSNSGEEPPATPAT